MLPEGVTFSRHMSSRFTLKVCRTGGALNKTIPTFVTSVAGTSPGLEEAVSWVY